MATKSKKKNYDDDGHDDDHDDHDDLQKWPNLNPVGFFMENTFPHGWPEVNGGLSKSCSFGC